MKAPFWYVVTFANGKYLAEEGPATRFQEDARPFLSRRKAKTRSRQSRDAGARVVRVWARLPKPRLPQWVDRHPRDDAQIEVWRHQKSVWRRYTFWVGNNRVPAVAAAFGDVGMWLGHVEVYRPGIDGSVEYRGECTAPPDVWVEAGLRAAAMLRKANR